MFGTVPDTAVLAATRQTSPTVLFSQNLHLFLLPKAMDTLTIDSPTGCHEFSMNPRTTEPRPFQGQTTHLTQQSLFVNWASGSITLGASWLAQYPTGPTFRNVLWPQTATHSLNSPSSPFGAGQFPREASFRMLMSNAWSATSLFRRSFSFCRAFSSLAISGFIPPYF